MNTCSRCGRQDRDVRDLIANREREARQDGRPYTPPPFAIEPRCPDRVACAARVRQEGTR